ncbi:hypothetical protein CFAM422_006697 [Trichoderma lentiforme]|uniref:Uncharacterized protein n=1 Tax=Trichoderma lentiforme TaxID=1567552 RepID=A0A9P5CB95_9HYPO|nr:hypothetical protein CFAM422_006697 [Trichoderma lentiforme]
MYKRIRYSQNRPTVIRPGGVTPNARLQVGHANFEGTEFKVEPDGSIAGRQTISHSLVTMPGNLIALKKWVLEAITFDNDNEHIAALTQCQVQDIIWVHKAALEIAEIPLQAYFVPARDSPVEECNFFYAIFPPGKVFLEKYEEAWRRLTKDQLLTLNLWDDEQDETARIQEATRGIDALDCHPVDVNDLVLYVRRPRDQDLKRDRISVKVFRDRTSATNCVSLEFPDQVADYKLKVGSTCAFSPNARPFNPIACGTPGQKDASGQWVPIPEESSSQRQRLLRCPCPSTDEVDQAADKLAKSSLDIGVTDKGELLLPKLLPVIDLIELPEEHLNALIEEALPADRQRFVKYLSERRLGLGAMTACGASKA